MPKLHDFQAAFLSDIYAGTNHSAAYLDSCQVYMTDRLGIYRNNMLLTLTDILASTYPVIQKLVGAGFFKTMARHYISEHPQSEGNRHSFGAELSTFLARYEPALSLPYLPDIAAIEWAYFQAMLAEDVAVISAQELGRIISTQANYALQLHPSVQLVKQSYNALEIWQLQHQESGSRVSLQHIPHQLLIWRDQTDALFILPVSKDMAALLIRCQEGADLAQTLSELSDPAAIQPEFARLLTAGAFVHQKESGQ